MRAYTLGLEKPRTSGTADRTGTATGDEPSSPTDAPSAPPRLAEALDVESSSVQVLTSILTSR
jgi:hypothetical protein